MSLFFWLLNTGQSNWQQSACQSQPVISVRYNEQHTLYCLEAVTAVLPGGAWVETVAQCGLSGFRACRGEAEGGIQRSGLRCDGADQQHDARVVRRGRWHHGTEFFPEAQRSLFHDHDYFEHHCGPSKLIIWHYSIIDTYYTSLLFHLWVAVSGLPQPSFSGGETSSPGWRPACPPEPWAHGFSTAVRIQLQVQF